MRTISGGRRLVGGRRLDGARELLGARRIPPAGEETQLIQGIHTLLFDGTEQAAGAPNSPTYAYPSFPGMCVTPAGSWLMVYRRAQGHGIQSPPTSSLRLSRSENQGHSWQDRITETVVVPQSVFYDPYTPSLTTLSSGRIALKYEIDWVTQAPDFAQSFDESAGTFVNELTDFNDTGAGGDIQLFPATEAVNDAFIVGKSERFTSIIWENDAATQGVGGTVAWEYFDGATWQALPGLVDGTSGFTVAPSLTLEHVVRWTMPSDWVATTINGSASMFFVRARVTQVYTTNPTMSFGYLRAGPFHDGLFLERTVHVAFSVDDGVTFDIANAVEIPRPVVTPSLRYTSAGGAIVELPNGDLISPDYYRQQDQIRYTSYCSRSQDDGATWTYLSIMAQHPSESSSGNDGGWQFEEPCIAPLDDGRVIGTVRTDDTELPIGGDDGTTSGRIWVVFSDDNCASFSEPEIAFPGNGLPAVLQMTNGIVVASSRHVQPTAEPHLWVSRERGAPGSWEGPHPYGLTTEDFALPRYMYSQIVEHPDKPNVACIGYGQEVSLNNGNRIAYLECGIDADPQVPAYRPTRSAKWGNLNNSLVHFSPITTFNGAIRYTASLRLRWNSTSGGTQHLYAISGGTGSNRVQRCYFSGGDLWVSTATGASEAHFGFTAPLLFDVNSHLFIVYDGGQAAGSRVRVWCNGVELVPSTITGTTPALLQTPGVQANFCLGAGTPAGTGGNPRDMFLADLAFWVGAAHVGAVAEIMNRHVAFDLATASPGAPTIWVPMNGDFIDRRGVLSAPTIVGSDITWDRTWTFGPGYLAA